MNIKFTQWKKCISINIYTRVPVLYIFLTNKVTEKKNRKKISQPLKQKKIFDKNTEENPNINTSSPRDSMREPQMISSPFFAQFSPQPSSFCCSVILLVIYFDHNSTRLPPLLTLDCFCHWNGVQCAHQFLFFTNTFTFSHWQTDKLNEKWEEDKRKLCIRVVTNTKQFYWNRHETICTLN